MAHELNIIPGTEWGFFTLPRPMCIAGPCSAESEEQVMETARGLAAFGIHVFRAGIWKPRTHPGSFEGVGTPGLRWLRRVKQELGMKVCTEVASEKHVLECIKYGVDVVWIGARTSANPFLMQEIADALEGTDIPVLVKALTQHPGALVVGSRNLSAENMPGGNTFANRFSNFWFRVQTARTLPDTQTGYRAYPLDRLPDLRLLTARYEAELTLLVFSAWKGVELVPVPIRVCYPEDRVTSFRPFHDFFRISLLNTGLCLLALVYGYPRLLLERLCR